MLKAAQPMRAKAQNMTGYVTGVVLCLWLALNFLFPVSINNSGFDLSGSMELTEPVHIPVGFDTSEGAEDDATLGRVEHTIPVTLTALALLALLLIGCGQKYSGFSARAPPV
ncbi:hypothetical protein QWI17_18680 [Gilvimarinus sp. SDUM040013]|uniref:Uncharacterized protein n=1 Tax=Gilvimarinus gilvus TaxID=3058038 RepID=A0ABU4RV74_9GAMM|nr:hypothetical protein [Gilvimarinus sp. SDUM040013]MDO3387877.1 hypothetical protein [Gilvimarinus sp. SDUM040013]MDX6848752.1 hypothetical protein [Gilvimarinus sp. SDUM040013]